MNALKLMDREQYLVNRKQQLIERKAQYEVKVAEVRAEIQEKQGKVTSKELANLRYKEILFQDELNCICHKLGIEVEEPVQEVVEAEQEVELTVEDEQEELAKFMESKSFSFVDYIEDSLDNMEHEFFIFNSSEYDLSVCIAHNKDFEDYDIFEICSVCDTVLIPNYYNYNNFKLIPTYRAENTISQFKRQFERWLTYYTDFKEVLNDFNDEDFQSYEVVDTIFYYAKVDAFRTLKSEYGTYMEGATDMYLNNKSKSPSTYAISCISSIKEFIKMITDKCTGGYDSYDMEYLETIVPPCIIAINRMEMLLERQERLLVNTNNIA